MSPEPTAGPIPGLSEAEAEMVHRHLAEAPEPEPELVAIHHDSDELSAARAYALRPPEGMPRPLGDVLSEQQAREDAAVAEMYAEDDEDGYYLDDEEELLEADYDDDDSDEEDEVFSAALEATGGDEETAAVVADAVDDLVEAAEKEGYTAAQVATALSEAGLADEDIVAWALEED